MGGRADSGNSYRSDDVLAEVKLRRKEKTAKIDEEQVKLIAFTLRDEHFALFSRHAKEILPVGTISYVPGAPKHITGLLCIRGDIESVLSIHEFLGVEATEATAKSRIIIAEANDIRSGIFVDSVDDVFDVPESAVQPLISSLGDRAKELVAGQVSHNSTTFIVIDVGKVFDRAIQ